MTKDIFWCAGCLNTSTRPRISFDDHGFCNACQWAKEKIGLDWTSRERELITILNKFRSKSGEPDCLVPVSGGKDGSYVASKLKHDYGMNPLTITITPALSLNIGDENLSNFIASGFDHLKFSINPINLRKVNKSGFIEWGFPYFGWLMGIMTVPVRVATKFGIDLIVYGEDGEVEYGGSLETKNRPDYDIDYMQRIYFEKGMLPVLKKASLSDSEQYWFQFPKDLNPDKLRIVHWSYFENWDPYRNYVYSKEHCGLREADQTNSGTFTNFAQNDQALYALHTYLMYLKFGFGRATQDAGIEIRRGAMDRKQGLNLVKLYDGYFPEEFIPLYLEYYEMSASEFQSVLNKHTNLQLFDISSGRAKPKFLPV